MSEDGPWFARRFPVGNPRNGLAPITREGWIVSWAFVGAMVLGAAIFIVLTFLDQFVAGLIAFIVIAIAADIGFVAIAVNRCDLTRTLEDYKQLRGPKA